MQAINTQSIFGPKGLADFPYSRPDSYQTLCKLRDGKLRFDPCSDSSGKKGIVIHGPNGTGKSELAKVIPAIFECSAAFPSTLESSASWNTGFTHSHLVETSNAVKLTEGLRERNKLFGNFSAKGWRYEIIDEAGQLTPLAMGALKAVMDRAYCTIFLFITNDWPNFDSGLKSRCYEVEMGFASTPDLVKRGRKMLVDAGVVIDPAIDQRLHRIAQVSGGNLRDMLSLIEELYGEVTA